jgi:hypothetical protein
MKYDLANGRDAGEAFNYLLTLAQEKKKVEIKKMIPRRSLNQNSYLHLLLGIFGQHFGYTIEESKTIYKTLPGNKDIYVYTKEQRGKTWQFLRSSADLNTAEMTKSIEIFREWSNKGGLYLPEANEEEKLRYYENLIEQNQHYL